MHSISTSRAAFLLSLLFFAATTYAATPVWPLKREIDLSSGFGDFRQKRFHAGLDLRTGGKIGDELFSPVDGHVWRIKMAYDGYGKGLYVKGADGRIYVFGHLSDFVGRLDRIVKNAQLEAKRYYVDLYFPTDSLPVKAGELLGHTGQTGTSAPHLHYEVRTSENLPINPLRHAYEIGDKTRPTFARVGFRLADDHSLFPEGVREKFFYVGMKKPGRYELDTLPYFNSPFVVEVDCADETRPGGMKQAVYSLTLYIDDEVRYEVAFDTLDFATGRMVDLVYDFEQAIEGEKTVRRLYHMPGNIYRGARPAGEQLGIFGLDPATRIGRHEAKVVAVDGYGNSTELHFDFLWGPPGYIYNLDSTVVTADTIYDYHFSPVAGWKELDIDSPLVLINRGNEWRPLADPQRKSYDNGRFSVRAAGQAVQLTTARLAVATRSGAYIIDNIFNGVAKAPVKRPILEYTIVDGGLLATITSDNLRSSDFYLRFFHGDSMLAAFRPTRLVTMQYYAFFIPPLPQYAAVDYIDVALEPDLPMNRSFGWKTALYVAGLRDSEKLTGDSRLSVDVGRENFYAPGFIGIEKTPVKGRMQNKVNSDLYRIKPTALIPAKDFMISFALDSNAVRPESTGLCWLDEKKDSWVWLDDSRIEGGVITASSKGGGAFAAVIDDGAPTIRDLTLHNEWTYNHPRPTVQFHLEDGLSGIRDDRSIVITIDGQWLIPEYEPALKICKSRPMKDLSNGKHQLDISVTDRAGNRAEQSVTFYVDVHR